MPTRPKKKNRISEEVAEGLCNQISAFVDGAVLYVTEKAEKEFLSTTSEVRELSEEQKRGLINLIEKENEKHAGKFSKYLDEGMRALGFEDGLWGTMRGFFDRFLQNDEMQQRFPELAKTIKEAKDSAERYKRENPVEIGDKVQKVFEKYKEFLTAGYTETIALVEQAFEIPLKLISVRTGSGGGQYYGGTI